MPTPKHDGGKRNRSRKVHESQRNLEVLELEVDEIDVDNVCLIKNGNEQFIGIKDEDSTNFYATFRCYYEYTDTGTSYDDTEMEKTFMYWLKKINICDISSIKFNGAVTISYKFLPEKLKIILKKKIQDFIYTRDRTTRFLENMLFDGSLDKLLKEINR